MVQITEQEAAELARLREKCERYREAIAGEAGWLEEQGAIENYDFRPRDLLPHRLRMRADVLRRVIEAGEA